MWDWLKAAQTLHAVLFLLGAAAAFRFAIKTRFWFPRYVHWLAVFAVMLGLGCLVLLSAGAPSDQDEWGGLKKALLVLLFPALVYGVFVFYGGQRVAYERTHPRASSACPYCRRPTARRDGRCEHCGQVLPSIKA
jgi:peptidoglycan/LPS O-acetylase OafA/YrhL